jgi:hypothetical protein
MICGPDPSEMCALCDEFSVRLAAPEYADVGMGRCLASDSDQAKFQYVAWNSRPCISYRVDIKNLAARRQYVAIQQQKETPP